jgi:hypothetical protein
MRSQYQTQRNRLSATAPTVARGTGRTRHRSPVRGSTLQFYCAPTPQHRHCAAQQRQRHNQGRPIDLRSLNGGRIPIVDPIADPIVKFAAISMIVSVIVVLIRSCDTRCAEQQYRQAESPVHHGISLWLVNMNVSNRSS